MVAITKCDSQCSDHNVAITAHSDDLPNRTAGDATSFGGRMRPLHRVSYTALELQNDRFLQPKKRFHRLE